MFRFLAILFTVCACSNIIANNNSVNNPETFIKKDVEFDTKNFLNRIYSLFRTSAKTRELTSPESKPKIILAEKYKQYLEKSPYLGHFFDKQNYNLCYKKDCECLKSPIYYSTIPLINLINSTILGTCYQNQLRSLLCNNEVYSYFRSYKDFSLWIEPTVGLAQYRADRSYNCFDLKTYAISLGIDYLMKDCLTLGFSSGYFHSKTDWKNSNTFLFSNSFYFGPYLAYKLNNGYISSRIYGIKNNYSINTKNSSQTLKNKQSNWNISVNLDSAFDIKIPFYKCNNFFLQPNFCLDYFGVFEKRYQDAISEEKIISVESPYDSFLKPRISLGLLYKYIKVRSWSSLYNIYLGWQGIYLLSDEDLSVEFQNDSIENQVVCTYFKSDNQFLIGARLIGMNCDRFLISFNFEWTFGHIYNQQIGKFIVHLTF